MNHDQLGAILNHLAECKLQDIVYMITCLNISTIDNRYIIRLGKGGSTADRSELEGNH